MSELVQREFVTERMGEGAAGISYAEFSYSLLQGYDFWWLFKNKDVELQIGASDQWGNMLSGVPLIRKKEGKEVHSMSMPLVVNKETGVKFGKSEAGAVWLDPAKTSPAEFYQFWINVSDEDVEGYLKIFTMLSRNDTEEIMQRHGQNPAERTAQKQLADAVTVIVHGEEGKQAAREHTDSLTTTTTSGSAAVKLASGSSLMDALVKTGLAASNSEARRVIDEGGVYINNEATQNKKQEKDDYE